MPDLAEDKELQQAGLRPKLKERFADRLAAALSGWKRMDLFAALGAERVIAGPVLRMDELGENPQFLARDFFRTAPSGVRYPGPFARMCRSAWRIEREIVPVGSCAARFETDQVPLTTPIRAEVRSVIDPRRARRRSGRCRDSADWCSPRPGRVPMPPSCWRCWVRR